MTTMIVEITMTSQQQSQQRQSVHDCGKQPKPYTVSDSNPRSAPSALSKKAVDTFVQRSSGMNSQKLLLMILMYNVYMYIHIE